MSYPISSVDLSCGRHTYVDLGHGDHTLVLLHGLSFKQGLYPLVERLTHNFRLVIPDLPFAPHQEFHPDHRVENYVDFILALIKKINSGTVSYFGNSFGATLAALCCIRDSVSVDKLILRSLLWTEKQLPAYLRIKPLITLHNLLTGNQTYARNIVNLIYTLSDKYSPSLDGSSKVQSGSKDLKKLPIHSTAINPSNLCKFLGDLMTIDIADEFGKIHNQTLNIWGGKDTLLKMIWQGKPKDFPINSRVLVMENEYHNITTIDPDFLSTSIIRFMTD